MEAAAAAPGVGVPGDLARTICEVHGKTGAAWLNGFPALLDACAQRWSLTVGAPFAGLSYNYVAPAVRADGTPVVLKLGVPHRELVCEIEALRLYDGRGIARLLDADAEGGALLLERLEPGTMLSHLAETDDQQATRLAARVMRQLWRPAPSGPHPFPSVADWAGGCKDCVPGSTARPGRSRPPSWNRPRGCLPTCLPRPTRPFSSTAICTTSTSWLPDRTIGGPLTPKG
jgi:streptomycin 6-kinase